MPPSSRPRPRRPPALPSSPVPEIEVALRRLDERTLRETVLPRLLRALGFEEFRHRHGPREEGKDLLAWRRSLLETTDWVGFVVKAGNLNGRASSSTSIRTVLHQVEQVLDHEILDPMTSALVLVRECWVVTNGSIPGPALDEVAPTLRRHHLDKSVRWIDLHTLARLIDRLISRDVMAKLLARPKTKGVVRHA